MTQTLVERLRDLRRRLGRSQDGDTCQQAAAALARQELRSSKTRLWHECHKRFGQRPGSADEIVKAAKALDALEDFSEPLGPGQDPENWDGYNAARKRLGDALKDYFSAAAHPEPELVDAKREMLFCDAKIAFHEAYQSTSDDNVKACNAGIRAVFDVLIGAKGHG